MAKKWSDVAASAAFQSLSLEEQEEARNQYFDGVIAPQVDPSELSVVRDQFLADTAFKPRGGRQELPAGVTPSAGRSATPMGQADPRLIKQEAPKRSMSDTALDAGITLLKGAIGLPESFVGLLDIPTQGRVGKFLEEQGYRPREAKEILDTYLSEAQQAANKKVQQAEGFVPTIKAALENPSTIATAVGESAPQMLGGAGVARGIIKAAPKVAPYIAGAVGEGLLGAGSAAEQIRGQTDDGLLTGKQSAAALVSGVGTAVFGAVGGRLASKLGFDDIDTMLATGASKGGAKSVADFGKRAAASGISEGVFEEMPQSAQEQMWQNYATDKPLLEGVPSAAGMGLVTGAAMGVAGGGAGSLMRPPSPAAEIAGAIDQQIANTEFSVPASEQAARDLLNPNAYDPSIVSPTQTSKIVNFTPPDSATKQAGLVDIEVPIPNAAPMLPEIDQTTEQEFGLDKLRMGGGNVGTGGTTQPAAGAGGVGGSDQLGGGVDLSGSAVDLAGGRVAGSAGGTAPNGQSNVVAGSAGAQPVANLTEKYNNGEVERLVEPWFGRKGGGYATRADAEQALSGRRRMFPDLQWRVDQMPNGRFMLGGYEVNTQETTLGNQTAQAQQTETQVTGPDGQGLGQQVATGGGAPQISGAAAGPLNLAAQPADGSSQPRALATREGSQAAGLTAPLRLAPPAPLRVIGQVLTRFKQETGINVEMDNAPLTESQQVASALARQFGQRVTYLKADAPGALPNGFVISQISNKDIFIAHDADDAPMSVVVHEVYHTLPEDKRKALNTQLLALFKEEKRGEFAGQFQYDPNNNELLDEEIPAFMAQAISKRADFWQELRTKMGDGEFAELARVILDKLSTIISGAKKEYGDDFVGKYINDIEKARDLLSTAYAEAMQAQSQSTQEQKLAASNRSVDIGAKLQGRIDADFDGAVAEYNGLKGTKGGRVLDTDIARELSPDYRADRSRSLEVHEAASDFTQRNFETRMAKPGEGEIVAFMAGGGGSGKSSAETLLAPILDRAATVLDGTLSSYDKAERNVQMALDSGRKVAILYVYRDPVDALKYGVLTRAMSGGRTVPIDALVKGHAGSSTVVRKLQAKFGDNPNFKLHVIDNSRGKDNAALSDLESITPVIIDGLKERFINATEQQYQAGAINDVVYRATVNKQADAGAEAQGRARVEEVQQGDGVNPTQGNQLVGSGDSLVQRSRRARGEQVGDFNVVTAKDGSLTVYGDPEQIRAAMPEGVVGRVTNDGVVFTNAAAPRVRAALEGRKIAYSRGGVVTDKLPMKDGKYLGAPAKFNTPGKIPQLRKLLRQLADEGAPGRYWYENSSREVLKMVGGDVTEARKFVALLAIYSPQAKVDANSTFALRAWAQYKAGQPISVKTGVMDSKAKNALDHVDEFWSGEKTGNFFFNLLREIDPSTQGKQGATIDMWMMRAGQYDTDAPTATQYAFMENETNRLAAELGWEPQQVQAAIWVAMKARMENAGVKKMTEASSEKKGWIRFERDAEGKKKRVIIDAQKHRDNWLKHSFEHDVTKDDTQQAKFDFGDGLKRHIGQISFEARPGRSTGVLEGIHTAPYAQQVEFQQAVQRAFYDEQGNDLLAMKLGLLVDTSDILLPGVWQGEVSPSSQKLVAMAPAKGDKGKTNVDPAQAEALGLYAAVAGLVAKQEGVGWHRPFYAGTKRDSNGIDINIGRAINPAEAKDLEAAVAKWMTDNGKDGWQDQFAFISSPNGIRVVNFGIITNDILHSEIVKVAEGVLPDFDYRLFASDGDMPSNNWKENPNGQSYVQRISAAGRSDLLEWTRDFLAPRVQRVFDDFAKRYDWGDAGSVQFSNRVSRLAEPAGRSSIGRDQGDAVKVEGAIHFGKQEGLSVLSGSSFGSGIKGAEQARLSEKDVDPRIKRRVYFYLPVEGGIAAPESGLGSNVYTATLSNLYDPSAGSRNFPTTPNAFESAVLDAGFRGYINREQGTAVVLNSDVPVKFVGKSFEQTVVPRKIERAVQPVRTRTEGDSLVRKPTGEEMVGIVKARPALAKVAPSFKLEFGEARVKASEAEAADQALADAGASFQFGAVMASNRAQTAGVAKPDAEVLGLFKDLQSSRGLSAVRVKERVAEHPMGKQIAKIHNDFYDILGRLDDAGLIKINCK